MWGERSEGVVGGGKAILDAPSQEPIDRVAKAGIDVRPMGCEGGDLAPLDGPELLHRRKVTPGPSPREQLIERHANREEVGPHIESFTPNLFGGHESKLALYAFGVGPARAVESKGNSEIGELYLALFRNKNVVGSDIAVDQPRDRPLDSGQCAQDAAGDVNRDALGEQAPTGEARGPQVAAERAEVRAADELEHQEGDATRLLSHREEGDDVAMTDACQQARLLAQTSDGLGAAHTGKAFDADLAWKSEPALAGPVDIAGAAPADALEELVAPPVQIAGFVRRKTVRLLNGVHAHAPEGTPLQTVSVRLGFSPHPHRREDTKVAYFLAPRPIILRLPMVPAARELLQPTARDVSARGARVRFLEVGSGPPLLLVHGFLSSHLGWEDVVPHLASHFRLVIPDLPGFGESEKPPPARYAYGFDAFAESLVDVIAALGLNRVSLCGHGLGGAVALTFAANHPDLVERLLLVDPLVYPARLGNMARVASMPIVGPVVFKQLFGRTMFKSYFRDQVYGSVESVPWARIDRLFDLFNVPAAREAACATALAMLDTRPLVARVPRIVAPTLVAWGRGDRISAVAQGRKLARELHNARFEVFECGHSPPEECPEAFVQVAMAFLAAAGGRAA